MFGTTKHTLPEEIILFLKKEPSLSAKSLLVKIREKTKRAYSLQAVYDQLRFLTKEGVLLKQKNFYSLNRDWLIFMQYFFQEERSNSSLPQEKKTIYTCHDLYAVDRIWKNIFYSLPSQPLFIYNPEPFWHLLDARKTSEHIFYQEIQKHSQKSYCIVAGTSQHYRHYRDTFKKPSFAIEIQKIPSMKENVHIVVSGDFILSTKIDQKVNEKIRELFLSRKRDIERELNAVASMKAKHKLIVEHNPQKALMYKKRIARMFMSEKKTRELFGV